MEMDTDILFVRPGFMRGVSRVVDFWGDMNKYNVSPTEMAADELALRSDLAAIGHDLRKAIATVDQNITSSTKD